MGDAEHHVHRQPAVRVGGQRHRPRNRLSRVPRSSTAPNLIHGEPVAGGASSNLSLEVSADAEEGANGSPQLQGMRALENSQSMTNFCKLLSTYFETFESDQTRSALWRSG